MAASTSSRRRHRPDPDPPSPSAPLWSWKGYMQFWSVGCRAPTLCKAFVSMKAKKSLGKTMVAAAAKRGKRQFGGGSNSSAPAKADDSAAVEVARSSRAELPARHSTASSCYYERLGAGEPAELMTTGLQKQKMGRRRSVDGADCCKPRRVSGFSSTGLDVPALPLRQLLVGNQFLTHLTAAPVPSEGKAAVKPSGGLLLQRPVGANPRLSDRVVFFL